MELVCEGIALQIHRDYEYSISLLIAELDLFLRDFEAIPEFAYLCKWDCKQVVLQQFRSENERNNYAASK